MPNQPTAAALSAELRLLYLDLARCAMEAAATGGILPVTEQDDEDARLTAESFTGAAHDRTTHDYAAWLCGHRLGWARSASEAEALVRDQLAREIDHRTVPA